jgi:hypothetical protein
MSVGSRDARKARANRVCLVSLHQLNRNCFNGILQEIRHD